MSMYDESALSQWQTKSPVHVGVYEVDRADRDGRAFCYWNGTRWGRVKWAAFGGGTIKDAIRRAFNDRRDPILPTHKWRGLRTTP